MTLPSVVLPGGSGGGGDSGPVTIHNYFPDGAIASAALVDVANAFDYDTHIWIGNFGTETLTFLAAGDTFAFRNRFNCVQVDVPGNSFNEGVNVGDWNNHYGGQVAAGTYEVGFTIKTTTSGLLASVDAVDANQDSLNEYSGAIVAVPDATIRRYVLDIAMPVAGRIILTLVTNANVPVNGSFPVAQPSTFYVGQIMMTDGDALIFADGDTAGWSWIGTHHASASSGPQG